MFDLATVNYRPDNPAGHEFDVRLTVDGYYAGNGKTFGNYDSAVDWASQQARRTKVTYDAFKASSEGMARVSAQDVSQIGGTNQWPPADSSMISRANWQH